jgi:hypothetical protein
MAKRKREKRTTIRGAEGASGLDESVWAAAERDSAPKPVETDGDREHDASDDASTSEP